MGPSGGMGPGGGYYQQQQQQQQFQPPPFQVGIIIKNFELFKF
jgi:hypothetical protein